MSRKEREEEQARGRAIGDDARKQHEEEEAQRARDDAARNRSGVRPANTSDTDNWDTHPPRA